MGIYCYACEKELCNEKENDECEYCGQKFKLEDKIYCPRISECEEYHFCSKECIDNYMYNDTTIVPRIDEEEDENEEDEESDEMNEEQNDNPHIKKENNLTLVWGLILAIIVIWWVATQFGVFG